MHGSAGAAPARESGEERRRGGVTPLGGSAAARPGRPALLRLSTLASSLPASTTAFILWKNWALHEDLLIVPTVPWNKEH